MTARPHANDPTRVLVLSGSIGAGHDAAAAAVTERVAARWPAATVRTVDVLGGSGVSERIYAACVRTLPWLYALHHWLLGHVPPFRAGTRAVLGRAHARAVAAALAAHHPDLVVTTVPEGVAALAHLRRRGRVAAPVVVVLADPAPHPLWCDADLDLHLVTTGEAARRVARHAPGARVEVAEVPVATARRGVPGGARAGRRVFVTTGSLALGDLPTIVAAVRAAGAEVITAHPDPAVRARLVRPDVEVRAWIDDPAAVLGSVDAVVTTGGGASCFEALASGVPLLVVDPVPGHGRANALVLARAGLARYCRTAAALTEALRGDLPIPRVGTAPDLATAIAPVVGTPRTPLRAEDALFLDAGTAAVPQVLGARVVVAAGAEVDWPALLADRVRHRAAGLDLLARRLDRRTWVPVVPDPADHVVPTRVTDPDTLATEVLAAPLHPRTIGWRLAAAATGPGETTIVAAVHHALGDGLAVTDALVRLLTDEAAALPTSSRSGAADPPPPNVGSLRGVLALARRGFAGRNPFPAGTGRGTRHVGRVWDAARVRRAARAYGTSTTVLALTVLAEALSGTGAPTIRAMVPLTARLRGPGRSGAAGNRTAAVAIDLPTAPLAPADRLARVASALEAARSSGQADGAVAVLAVLGRLPAGVQHAFARLTYRSAFFHLLTSVMPGVRRPLHVAGGRVRQVVPILPLAPGVGLAFGVIAWADTLGVGITLDDAVVDPALDVPGRVDAALARLCGPAATRGEEDRGFVPAGRRAR